MGPEFCFLVNDFKDLLDASNYDRFKYEDFYKNKYNVELYDEKAENITRNSATLKCILSTDDVRKGYANFIYGSGKYVDNKDYSEVEASITNIGENTYLLTAQVGGLEPDKLYVFYPHFYVNVDGIRLSYCGAGIFFTKPNKLPNMAGKWTFNQTYFSDKSLNLDLNLSSVNRDSTRATYKGGWGANMITVTVYSNGEGYINVSSSGYTAVGDFHGFFNSDYTCLSGKRYYRCANDIDPGYFVEDSWSLSR